MLSRATGTLSTMAEMEGLYQAIIEGLWIRNLMKEVGIWRQEKLTIYQDNQVCISLVRGSNLPNRIKHEIVKLEAIREYIRNGDVDVTYVKSEHMKADIMTKAPTTAMLHNFFRSVSMINYKADIKKDDTSPAIKEE